MNKHERQLKMNELANIFGYETAEKMGKACRGKWAGTTDYFVKFENLEFYISNGMRSFDNVLEKLILKYKAFMNNKKELFMILKQQEVIDNNIALHRNLQSYKIIDIDICRQQSYLGWIYLTIEVNGKRRTFVESNLKYKLEQGPESLKAYLNNIMDYKYKAGGVDKEDFIFHGVGFNFNEGYSIN